MYLAFSCPTVSSTSLLINPPCGYLTCPVPKSQDSTASPRIASSDHSKGHQRLCSLLTLTARQTMANKGTWESAYISLWTSIPFPEALRSFSEPRPTFLPKTHVYMLHFGDFTLINLDLGSSRGETYSGENYWSRNKVDMQYALKLRRAHAVGRKEILRFLTMPSHPQPRLSL